MRFTPSAVQPGDISAGSVCGTGHGLNVPTTEKEPRASIQSNGVVTTSSVKAEAHAHVLPHKGDHMDSNFITTLSSRRVKASLPIKLESSHRSIG